MVIGIGLNVSLGGAVLEKIAATGIAPTDLAGAGLVNPSRNEIAANLVTDIIRGLLEFEREGLKPFIVAWRAADALHGQSVIVQGADGATVGVARGIDVSGALIVETAQGLRRFISGDVSVRATT